MPPTAILGEPETTIELVSRKNPKYLYKVTSDNAECSDLQKQPLTKWDDPSSK